MFSVEWWNPGLVLYPQNQPEWIDHMGTKLHREPLLQLQHLLCKNPMKQEHQSQLLPLVSAYVDYIGSKQLTIWVQIAVQNGRYKVQIG